MLTPLSIWSHVSFLVIYGRVAVYIASYSSHCAEGLLEHLTGKYGVNLNDYRTEPDFTIDVNK